MIARPRVSLERELRVERGFTIDDQTDPSEFQTLHGSVEQPGGGWVHRNGTAKEEGRRKMEGKLLFPKGKEKKKKKKKEKSKGKKKN
jgi:hypothetical protein